MLQVGKEASIEDEESLPCVDPLFLGAGWAEQTESDSVSEDEGCSPTQGTTFYDNIIAGVCVFFF